MAKEDKIEKVEFTPNEGVVEIRIPFQHIDEDVILEGGKVFETSDQAIIDALDARDDVKRGKPSSSNAARGGEGGGN